MSFIKSRDSRKKLFGHHNNSASTNLLSDSNNETDPSPSTSSSFTSLPTLRTRPTETDREILRKRFEKFTEDNKENFWYLKSTKEQARMEETSPLSVKKVINFALECKYYHPSQSLILDLTEKNWKNVFTQDELDEVNKEGGSLVCHEPEELERNYAKLKKMKLSVGVYQYGRAMEINDPVTEHVKVWMSQELQNIAYLFLKSRSFNIADMPETDKRYLLFGFFNTIFVGSDIVARGTEISREANGYATN
ncbi:hypothetical protein INT45_008402 [Circinella minor]|uniref:Uncharacterized protein n=1 Tax=Circinella minor TaxID=1195481 RepID=A0A8H7VJN9_9FUNG|nr:hypothetical protein INT45_008402 [Circinella minor]